MQTLRVNKNRRELSLDAACSCSMLLSGLGERTVAFDTHVRTEKKSSCLFFSPV